MSNIPIQRGQQWLKTLLELSGISTEIHASLETAQPQDEDSLESDNYWLTIDETNLTPEQIQVLIGTDGSVLDAIQYLANSVLNLSQSHEGQASYTIELNGYRIKRQAEIRALAEAAADEVRFSGREVEIKSLSSAERRQVHTFLKDFGDLETFSRGKEPHRHLVVRPAALE
ncbi:MULTISPECIES: R3H domain-containing nucleic acid-binding protein [Nostoc]|jgi:spoIIIJ-associated protein|uniref:RNA-binding protein n=1 Tax=Nostoc punctiforme FACHB-252 TaxID=1357509 RepID=A0ABR8HEG9_NOSPU|nr:MULTISPECIES: R3H domain-containing nucleic acid-binding protein [Nostoc]MBC1240279.1 RNA-binding protein [Nostoc sp. 2RC]MBD2614190.1 RNA-binding protein [Nostoc punctiforme FACHB-252]MBL1197580.1 RNA-binding protein [Nostoc sp. GBBB01]MDZ8015015.1 R3H domain-containing nucleic acid-binding protein [Nostoc sp. ZfuVER08]